MAFPIPVPVFQGTGIDKGKPPPSINVEVYGFVLWIATAAGYCMSFHFESC